MNKNLIITLTAVSCVIAAIILTKKSEDKDEFSAWKKKFPGDWDVREDAYRKLIFFSNLDKINKHNADKTHTYKMGISQFTAYTDSEFTLTYLSPKVYDP